MSTVTWWLKCPHCNANQTEYTQTPDPKIVLKCQECLRLSPFDKWIVVSFNVPPKERPRYDPRFEDETTTEPMVPRKPLQPKKQ